MSDDELVRRCRGGDMSAFEHLVNRYQDRVYNVVYRLTGHREDALDITQEVFLRALEHIGAFRQQAQVYTWLFRIAVNMTISRRRRTQRVKFMPLDGPVDGDGEATGPEPVSTRTETPDDLAQRSEHTELVATAIGRLDEEFRAVLVLKDIQGLDYREIAEVLELPLGTVKSRLHRARLDLREQLGPIFET